MGACSLQLKDAGVSYPRTCSLCGLGPCTMSARTTAEQVEAFHGFTETELIKPEDTVEAFKEKFAGSLESMAEDMDTAREVFAADHDIVGAFMATSSWLKKSAKAIRDSKAI